MEGGGKSRWQDPGVFIRATPVRERRFNRVPGFHNAACEDLEVLGAWFRLVENVRATYGVMDSVFYNFDETGFMMGVFCPRLPVTKGAR